MSASPDLLPEWAFYYPNPVWSRSHWLRNLVLFFDGIVLLAPEFAREDPFAHDPETATRLRDEGLLEVVEPPSFIDRTGAQMVAEALTDLLASGALDELTTRHTEFQALAYSQLGYMTDGGLAELIYQQLHARGMTATSTGSGSLHPVVRSLLLVLLAQLLRPTGRRRGMYLCPVTDRHELHAALSEVIGLPSMASSAPVVSLDMQTVGVDLSDVPLDEVLAFRRERRPTYRTFARDLRSFVHQTVDSPASDRPASLLERQLRMAEAAARLLAEAGQAFDRPAAFALGLTGAAWGLGDGDIVGNLLALGTDATSPPGPTPTRAGAFSYLFSDRTPR